MLMADTFLVISRNNTEVQQAKGKGKIINKLFQPEMAIPKRL